jgi:TRAP-type C4-dicarboxylate transport system permease large subunit
VFSVLLMIAFGSVLEGAPALTIFGPMLTPIAVLMLLVFVPQFSLWLPNHFGVR